MKKISFILLLFLLFPFFNVFAVFQPVAGIESANIKKVAVSKLNPLSISVVSDNCLYKSKDSGKEFKKIAVFKDEKIQQIFFDCCLVDILYVVTSRHLYKVTGETLSKLYSVLPEQVIYSALKHKGELYIGTNSGLYHTLADNLIWNKVKSANELSIYYIEAGKKNVYLATDRGVYVLKANWRAERLFVIRKTDLSEQERQDIELEDFSEGLTAKVIKQDIFEEDRFWLGTNNGLYISDNSGNTWRKVYLTSLMDISVNCLEQTILERETLYVGSDSGFFVVDIGKETAREIFEGLSANDISGIAFTDKGIIYLASSGGLFKSVYFSYSSSGDLENILKGEPSIQEVQNRVMRYNQVHPEKIKKWRDALKYRALFPDVSLDYDKTIWGSYTGGGSHYVGPRDWGVSFSWDTGDLLWNSYEDDVDTRARLNTQLRLDILDEINRIYFERLRLKKEIIDRSFNEEELFNKQLRLEELTAALDGYTGGFFSKRIGELSEE